MFKSTFLFAMLLSLGVNVFGAPLAPTPTGADHGTTRTVSVNCAGPKGENICSPAESAAINSALASILPAVEGKPGWTVNRADDGEVVSITIEGNEALGGLAPGHDGEGELGAQGFWSWLGSWRYDYNIGIGPKK